MYADVPISSMVADVGADPLSDASVVAIEETRRLEVATGIGKPVGTEAPPPTDNVVGTVVLADNGAMF